MQPLPDYVMQLRKEVRLLRVEQDRLRRAHQSQKQKAEQLQAQVKEQERRIKEQERQLKELSRENEQLKAQVEQSSKTKLRYQVALFDHGNFRRRGPQEQKKKGGQPGHADTNREARGEQPPMITQRLFAPVCGQCGEPLSRVRATRSKLLVDVELHPQAVVRRIESERQWCGHCQQEVCARESRCLPFTEYGLNTFLLVMLLRFQAHAS